MSVRVLIVEQTDTLRDAFIETLNAAGLDAFGAKNFPEAGVQFAKRGADIVVLDLLMMSGNASMLLGGILGALPNTRIIATTASGAMRQASVAVQQGAFDYLVKPIDPKRLLVAVQNAVAANEWPSVADDVSSIAYYGEALPDIMRMVPSSAPFLIEGEVGTRKQGCAAMMHQLSHRAGLPFVVRNCARFSGLKIEDLFSTALLKQGGTLYLSNPSHLSLRIQTQLLRFLQLPIFDADGSVAEHTNIRIIFGTSIGLEGEVDGGRFREDLFYRLKVARVMLRPLRERSADVPGLAQVMMHQIADELGQSKRTLAEDAASILSRLSWPGNLGTLQAVLSQTMQDNRAKVLRAEMLPEEVLAEFVDATQSEGDGTVASFMDDADTSVAELIKAGWSLAKLERLVVEMTIALNGGSVPKAAKKLEVSPSTLYRKREAWALKAP